MTLDQFLNESIRISSERNYHPTTFIRMRNQYGSVGAIQRLVETSDPKSGFLQLRQMGLLDWTLESAVMKFPEQFTKKTAAYAKTRLEGKFDL